MTYRTWLLVALCTPVAACGGDDDPVDVAGDYSVAITNRDNGCDLQPWAVGDSNSGIAVTITQDAKDKGTASATVGGLAGVFLTAAVGGNQFTGSVDGDELDLKLLGTTSHSKGNCTYTYNAVISGVLAGDALTGKISYQAATNNGPDCGALTGCSSVQDFNGTRPPR
jgi:hypothetical protein